MALGMRIHQCLVLIIYFQYFIHIQDEPVQHVHQHPQHARLCLGNLTKRLFPDGFRISLSYRCNKILFYSVFTCPVQAIGLFPFPPPSHWSRLSHQKICSKHELDTAVNERGNVRRRPCPQKPQKRKKGEAAKRQKYLNLSKR